MKIVINKCYGGFSLSEAAENLYAQKKDFQIFRYVQTKYKYKDGKNKYEKTNDTQNYFINYTFTIDLGDSFEEWPDDNYYWSSRDIDRDDPILVAVVEELGKKANDSVAKLKIVEIPNNVGWQIEEYDGIEWVSETHKTWS